MIKMLRTLLTIQDQMADELVRLGNLVEDLRDALARERTRQAGPPTGDGRQEAASGPPGRVLH